MTPDSRVTDAIRGLGSSGDFVRLADVRTESGLSQDEFAALLRRMEREGKIHLAPDSNAKSRTAADRAAAIRVGGEDNHLVALA